MTTFTNIPNRSKSCWKSGRRSPPRVPQDSGMLVVSFSAAAARRSACARRRGARLRGPYPDPDFQQLDSWIVIHQDNTATFYVGKTDCGQGTGTAFRQMMSDELDIAYDKTRPASWAAPTSPSTRADPAARMRFRPTAGRCAALPPKRGACCSTWRPQRLGVPVDQLAVSDARDHREGGSVASESRTAN